MNTSNGDVEHALLQPRSRDPHLRTGAEVPRAARPPGRRRRSGRLVVGFILVLAAILAYAHWKTVQKNTRSKSGPPPVMISTATASIGDIGVYVQALGTVTPLHTVSLTARVAGQIAQVEYNEGQHAHVGDPLVEIDPAPFQAAVTQAEGQLARDQAQLELAKINLDRDTDLLKKGVISKQEFD
jgi:membrane fusion protein, multidrug efflux system